MRHLSLAATSLFVAMTMWQTSAFAQSTPITNAKTLLVDRPLGPDPVRIEKVMMGATELRNDGHIFPGKHAWESQFAGGDDWLKDISFVIRNTSVKKIVYVAVGCHLYETADWQTEIASHRTTPVVGQILNVVGRRPEQALYSPIIGHMVKADTRPSFELSNGQTFAINLEDPEEYLRLKSNIEEKQSISSVTACNAGIVQLFFDDGTQWQSHHYLRPDPSQPGRWLKISAEDWVAAAKTAE